MTHFAELDAFTQGHIEAMELTETHCDSFELAPKTLKQIEKDCKNFQQDNWNLLERAITYSGEHLDSPYGSAQAGHDFWLTRNGYGAGFRGRALGDIGNALAEATLD